MLSRLEGAGNSGREVLGEEVTTTLLNKKCSQITFREGKCFAGALSTWRGSLNLCKCYANWRKNAIRLLSMSYFMLTNLFIEIRDTLDFAESLEFFKFLIFDDEPKEPFLDVQCTPFRL